MAKFKYTKPKHKSSSLMGVFSVVFFTGLLGYLFFYNNKWCEGLSNDKEFILVYMSGCGHCTPLLPKWDAVSKNNTTGINMQRVEMSEGIGPELCKKYNITGFPTMIYLENGKKVADYTGERSETGLLSFLKSKS